MNEERLNARNESNKDELINIIKNILSKGAAYAIKSLPVGDHIKEVLRDIKKALDEKEFEQILNVALASSINQGMEVLGITQHDIKTIGDLSETAMEGGLQNNINIGIDVVEKIKSVGNIFGTYIKDFFKKIKNFVSGREFKKKLEIAVERCMQKVEEFKSLCSQWHIAYDALNLPEIESIAKILKRDKYKVSFDDECQTENSFIQNITEVVSRNRTKLTKNQYEIFENMK